MRGHFESLVKKPVQPNLFENCDPAASHALQPRPAASQARQIASPFQHVLTSNLKEPNEQLWTRSESCFIEIQNFWAWADKLGR